MGLNAIMLVFWMLSFKSAFSLSSLAEANYYFVTFKYIILDLFNSLNDKGNLQFMYPSESIQFLELLPLASDILEIPETYQICCLVSSVPLAEFHCWCDLFPD